MRFIDFMKPVLQDGKHTVSAVQSVTAPREQGFTAEEQFYVASRAYTLGADDVFSVSPTENECGDFSRLLPFITLENKSLPWERKIADDISGKPTPWVALIVIAAGEEIQESDITIAELLGGAPEETFFPDRNSLPEIVTESPKDLCHILDIPISLYQEIMPGHEDMTYLAHVRRVNLADTEDSVSERDGDFSVVMANRFIPTGEKERQKSTVHLVSMLGIPEKMPDGYKKVRLVSLHRWNVYSVRDDSQTFQRLIDGLSQNTGVIGFDKEHEMTKRGYVPKKHLTRSGEATYSLYRSPLIPYANKPLDAASRVTADGYMIYDPQTGVFDVSYAAAFQLGRLISLGSRAEGEAVSNLRKRTKIKAHKNLLRANIQTLDVKELCKKMVKEMG
ncbi:hypothetical protein AB9D59_16280 [Blautia producta]|uniref:hypothetical protein n=1 Tax=Blautia producta TaxID=33035 RepID=UPI0012DD9939